MHFYIIYTPGTVERLLFLLHSLLQWSDCTFSLVANGCGEQEARRLQTFCQTTARFCFVRLPAAKLQPHGLALNDLQKACDHPYFAFMDSDIYATGAFIADFTGHLAANAGLFSGAPLWSQPADQLAPTDRHVLAGRHHYIGSAPADRICVGSSYFAIYDNRVLTDLRAATGVGFESYRWSQVPTAYQQGLQRAGHDYQRYETGKLLNLLLHREGYPLSYQASAHLHHIGGLSRFAVAEQRSRLDQTKRWLKRLLAGKSSKPTIQAAVVSEDYFARLLWGLQTGQPLPALPTDQAATLAAKMQRMADDLTKLYAEVAPEVESLPEVKEAHRDHVYAD